MATYAIGDVQGCFEALSTLLRRIRFDRRHDRLWFVGDLVNRGPASLDVLRFVRALGDRATVVLGNHDLHLLAVAAGAEPLAAGDTLDRVLDAPDREALIAWLARRPLFHRDRGLGCSLVHAGIPPRWDLATAESCAREVERALRGPARAALLEHMYGDEPAAWDAALTGWDRLRFTINGLTRMRYCTAAGDLVLPTPDPPAPPPPGCMPWFDAPDRPWPAERLVFGHWAALDPDPSLARDRGLFHLDTGCVWGGRLTALRLEDEGWFRVDC